ncbi:NAD(P)H nitroreductase [Paractinoplanes ferrugineus]|uniref:NAD(P)H nitroreductase n=1 Tax=Paractinoplanes ferrugineus TaxID=113564 RepID=A0A919J2G2_9ACTN|nr:nitroreductase [Actinoplanes ferrugineus]GIE13300.1 NAD(P)H nitroreductase [Actinoplanes ferrugineus]
MTPLELAARTAQRAPSILNTQPWTWRITGNVMELSADPDRRIGSIDPDGRLLLLSCGAALHHARIALNSAGWATTVDRLPDQERPDLLARIRLTGETTPDPEDWRMAAAIRRRRTDRRAFADEPVSDFELTKLRRFVESEGTYLHVVRPDQLPMLAACVRDLAPGSQVAVPADAARDRGAAYVVLFGVDSQPLDLLRAGEALSALLLLATADGLATAPLSDAVEIAWPHQLLRGLLAGLGEPYVAVRLGHARNREPLPPVPRRDPRDVIAITD